MFNAPLRRYFLIFLAGMCLLVGCQPQNSTVDEQKETHYLRGRNRVSTQDYSKAIEEFEQALQVNPKSAAAHFELAWLHEEHMKDWASAIYHYQKHLQLKPDSEYAERARERMKACKLELARTEVLSPVTQDMQSQLHRLQTENMLLKSKVDSLQAQLASRPAVPAPVAHSPATSVVEPPPQVRETPVQSAPVAAIQTPVAAPRPVENNKPVAAAPKAYKVKRGDTIFSIAKAHGVSTSKLLQANPRVDYQKLQVGQTVMIPAQ